ncbi:MAG: methylamine utilization protein [Rhizobiaceae bacterium]|nr:methylamine utilization protein [Rhizobiaceae bacterium]
MMLACGAVAACNPSELTDAEIETAKSLTLAELPPVPPDPTNRVADDSAAAALGATLFFDPAMSIDGEVSCATCHQIDNQFQDGLPRGHGIATTDRRTMPLAGVAYSPWQFWDGRRDSLWAQALTPLEDLREHGGTRTFYAHLIAERYADRYERIFGPLPDLTGLPVHAGPRGSLTHKAAWARIPPERQEEIDTVFANIGKAIAAFERTILPEETRFDRYVAALASGKQPEGGAAFTDLEREGLRLFIGKAGCINCHNGPRLTDDHFHNTGVPAVDGLPEDRGRAQAVRQVISDPFNCFGPFSDGTEADCGELRFMVPGGEELERAYKTPSLRGVASRPPYMHAGQYRTLEEAIDHYSRAPEAPAGKSEIPALVFTDRGRAALIAFLKTLD